MTRASEVRSEVMAARTAGAATMARKHRLEREVAAFVRNPDEARFEKLALELFAYQFETIAPYQRLCRGQGLTPERVRAWRQIPAVPAEAFKVHALFAGELEVERVRTFRSSGTSDPARASQAHFSAGGLELMNLAVAEGARRSLFAELGARKLRLLVLAPSPEQAPHMIMVNGMAHLMRCFGLEGSGFLVGDKAGLDVAALLEELRRCQEREVAVALVGSSFGFVHFFDWLEGRGERLALPQGSRLLDAGGYKGRSREIGRDEFVAWASRLCGVPAARVVNLLGMTELASQIYDAIDEGGGGRRKLPPPWMRSDVIDPRRRGEGGPRVVADGELGLLRHFDLTNVERPAMIQSEDVARRVGDGFEILGRAKGAEPRGCSLSAEDLGGAGASRGARELRS